MTINQRLNFDLRRLHENQIQELVSAILISWWKVCIFQTGIGILEVYLIGYQSLRKLDYLQIIRKSLFSLKNKNLIMTISYETYGRVWSRKESTLELKYLIPYRNWTNMIVWVHFLHKIFTMIFEVAWWYTYYIFLRKL